MKQLPKIVVILGPTASGKSGLAYKLAKKFKGVLINADSRQVYREMNVATAKFKVKSAKFKVQLQDIIKPNQDFSVAEYKIRALGVIKQVLDKKGLPILVGGTGLYLSAVVDNLEIPVIKADKKLRKKLERLTAEQLFKRLWSLDKQAAEVIDRYNKRRLIRALEVCLLSGRPFSQQRSKGQPLYQVLQLGLNLPRPLLYQRINQRVDKMFKQGLVAEAKRLVKKYSLNLPSMSGIGYREIISYLRGQLTLGQTKELIKKNTRHYAKRQITWFKRDRRISWVRNYQQADKLVRKFIK